MDFSLRISEDRLSATLDLPARRHLELPLLKEFLSRAEIRSGLQRDALKAATERNDADRSLILAVGEPMFPGHAGGLAALTPTSPEQPVHAGDLVGPWQPAQPPRPGLGVDGQPIPAPAAPTAAFLGVGVRLREDGQLEALRDGVLRQEANGCVRVTVPGLTEREVKQPVIALDTQRLTATLILASGEYATQTNLQNAMVKAQLSFGVDQSQVALASCPEDVDRTLVLAKGIPAVPGRDAVMEVLIDESLHVKVDDFDRVDYHELNKTCEVSAGTLLARIQPAVAGIPGTNVRGQPIKTKNGNPLDANAFIGEGVRVNAQDGNVIEAEVTGAFRRHARSGKFQIQQVMTIDGDIDLKNGNVDTKLPVIVKGDVKAGFSLKTGADVTVMGVIEDARVSAQGNITVRGGILPGRNRVKAHGKVTARHISGREVKGHDIEVATSIRFSRILATGSVTAKEIISSRIIAAGNVHCDTLGTSDEPHTQVQVGINPFEEALYLAAQQEQGRHETDVVRLKERCKLFAHKLALRGEQPASSTEDPLAADLRAALLEFSTSCKLMAECEAVISRHSDNLEESNQKAARSSVIVRNTAFPGVEILIGELARLDLKERLASPRFCYRDGAISYE